MGNLLCCCNNKATNANLEQLEFDPFDYCNAQTQQYPKEAFQNLGQQIITATPTNQAGPQRSKTVTKSATGGKIKFIYSNPSYKPSRQVVVRKAPNAQKCSACGYLGHTTDRCRYHTRMCFYCREEGHIIRICPKRKRRSTGNRMHRNGTYPVASRKHKKEQHHVTRKRYNATNVAKKPVKQHMDDLPPGVRRKSWTPIGTIVTLGTIEDFADDDPLQKKSGCDDLIYLIMCCL